MASAKDIYEAKVYAAGIYAAGVFRGVGVDVVPNDIARFIPLRSAANLRVDLKSAESLRVPLKTST